MTGMEIVPVGSTALVKGEKELNYKPYLTPG